MAAHWLPADIERKTSNVNLGSLADDQKTQNCALPVAAFEGFGISPASGTHRVAPVQKWALLAIMTPPSLQSLALAVLVEESLVSERSH